MNTRSIQNFNMEQRLQQEQEDKHPALLRECLNNRGISSCSVVTEDSHESTDTLISKASSSSSIILPSTISKTVTTAEPSSSSISNNNDKYNYQHHETEGPNKPPVDTANTCTTNTNQCTNSIGMFPLTTLQSPEDHIHDSKNCGMKKKTPSDNICDTGRNKMNNNYIASNINSNHRQRHQPHQQPSNNNPNSHFQTRPSSYFLHTIPHHMIENKSNHKPTFSVHDTAIDDKINGSNTPHCPSDRTTTTTDTTTISDTASMTKDTLNLAPEGGLVGSSILTPKSDLSSFYHPSHYHSSFDTNSNSNGNISNYGHVETSTRTHSNDNHHNISSSSFQDLTNYQFQQPRQTRQLTMNHNNKNSNFDNSNSDNNNKMKSESKSLRRDLNVSFQSLMKIEAEVEEQLQKCLKKEREFDEEKKKYLQILEKSKEKRKQLVAEIHAGTSTIPDHEDDRYNLCRSGSDNGLGLIDLSGDNKLAKSFQLHQQRPQQAEQEQMVQYQNFQNHAQCRRQIPMITPSSTTTSSPHQIPSALDALALACANEKSLISQGTISNGDWNTNERSPRSIVVENSDDGSNGSTHEGNQPLKKQKLRHSATMASSRSIIQSSPIEDQHYQKQQQQHPRKRSLPFDQSQLLLADDQNKLKVPYRAVKSRTNKLSNNKQNKLKKKHSPTASRMKSNRNLQLPTHELELALYQNKMVDRSNSGGNGVGNQNEPSIQHSSDVSVIDPTQMPKPPQHNAATSSALLSELVAPLNEKDEDFAVKQFADGNWSNYVTVNDVLCGRGGLTNNHEGNVFFRTLVRSRQETYLFASKRDKALVAHGIVDVIRSLKPPGRFLKKDKKDLWTEIGNKKAREKTSQALREKAPELMEMLQKDLETQNTIKLMDKLGKKDSNVRRSNVKIRQIHANQQDFSDSFIEGRTPVMLSEGNYKNHHGE